MTKVVDRSSEELPFLFSCDTSGPQWFENIPNVVDMLRFFRRKDYDIAQIH